MLVKRLWCFIWYRYGYGIFVRQNYSFNYIGLFYWCRLITMLVVHPIQFLQSLPPAIRPFAAGKMSNFYTHLHRMHSEKYDLYMCWKAHTRGGSVANASFDDRIVAFIVDTAQPISIVDRKSFYDLFKDTNLKVMSRGKLMKKLEERYRHMVGIIKREIADNKYFCTTADIWSASHRSFLGYTCHWLGKNFERK